jgi:hypothetical protein
MDPEHWFKAGSLSPAGVWVSVWAGQAGPKGHEVTDDTEDVLLPQFTTENPLAGGDPAGEPAFNSQVTHRLPRGL